MSWCKNTGILLFSTVQPWQTTTILILLFYFPYSHGRRQPFLFFFFIFPTAMADNNHFYSSFFYILYSNDRGQPYWFFFFFYLPYSHGRWHQQLRLTQYGLFDALLWFWMLPTEEFLWNGTTCAQTGIQAYWYSWILWVSFTRLVIRIGIYPYDSIKIGLDWQQCFIMVSDWLAAQPSANQKPC